MTFGKLPVSPSISINGARFTLANATLESTLLGDSRFYDNLDGVHGPLRNGLGVTIMREGDGYAVVWAASPGAASVVLVDMF